MNTDKKISLLVNRQLPEFVREEYPLFQSFLEAYYEFLENKVEDKKNDQTNISRRLQNVSDVDLSLAEFESNFLNTFASFFPKQTSVDKEFLIKNVLPFYLAKGSERSFKFLFRALFNKEINFKRLSENIIRASDGEWIKENKLRIDKDFRLIYTGDGSKRTFNLLFSVEQDELRVFVNGNLVPSNDYFVQPENLKITFYTAPAQDTSIEIFQNNFINFNPKYFFNRKIEGLSSGAFLVCEKIVEEKINVLEIFSIFSAEKNINGIFLEGEVVEINTNNDFGDPIKIHCQTISILKSINIIDGGSNYKIGNPVKIIGGQSGSFQIAPSAIISDVFSGLISKINIPYGGAGFVIGDTVEPIGISNVALQLAIESVNTSGVFSDTLTSNTFNIFTDVIEDIDPANTTIDAADYGFPANVIPAGENVNTILSQAFSNTSYTNLGPITSVAILFSNTSFSEIPKLDATPASLILSNNNIFIKSFGSLARFRINEPGQDYEVGDDLVFTNAPMSLGIGAEASVTEVDNNGGITRLEFEPFRLTGIVSVANNSTLVLGNGTIFEDELVVGDRIFVNRQERTVTTITSNTTIAVDDNFTANAANVKIGKFGVYPLGGQNYTNDKLPAVSINSANGFGANVEVTTIFGDGEDLIATGTKKPGEILKITILNPGRGFVQLPTIDLTDFGDGTALANATIENPISVLPGKFISSKGIVSAEEMRIQSSNNYHLYSYTISAEIEFNRYKNIIRNLIHPAGFQEHGEWFNFNTLEAEVQTIAEASNTVTYKALSGKVSTQNNSIYVTGTGTNFLTANNLGIISIGAYITINSEIRVVDSIISNTNLSVTSAFTITTGNEDLVVINTVFDAVSTEILEDIKAENDLVLKVEA
jgi:hypothetical protein